MGDAISVTISVFALCLSALTAWLTLFRRGTVKMTQPTVIYLGPDSPRARDESPLPKVFLRTLLFATSKRGRIVESMHIRSCEYREILESVSPRARHANDRHRPLSSPVSKVSFGFAFQSLGLLR